MSGKNSTEGMIKAAVIGDPIAQSMSPFLHNHWFRVSGIKGQYEAIEVKPDNLKSAVSKMQEQGFAGFNVTMPHKQAIIPLLDRLAPSAHQIKAVNTVKINEDGSLSGFNTDVPGLISYLNETAPGWPKDKPALLIGAGGAARAAAAGLLAAGVPMVMICNRTKAKAEDIAISIGAGRMTVVDWKDRNSAVVAAGVIINTSALGMVGNPALDLDLTSAGPDTVVYDIVYKPLETDLLKEAKSRGLRTVDGLGMLVHQGAAAFKIWFGYDAKYDSELRLKLNQQFQT